MPHARTLTALLALAAALTPLGATAKASATTRPDIGVTAEPAGATDDHRHEPWRADYPASQELDGAMVNALAAQVRA